MAEGTGIIKDLVRRQPISTASEVWKSTYSNLYDIYFYEPSGGLVDNWMESELTPWMCFRAEAIQLGDVKLEGEFDSNLRATLLKGFSPLQEVGISFRENAGYTVLRTLKARFDTAFNLETRTMKVGGPAQAKMDIKIVLQNTSETQTGDSSFVGVGIIELKGALIQGIPTPQLSWKDSSAVIYQTKFWVDDVKFELPGIQLGDPSLSSTSYGLDDSVYRPYGSSGEL